MASLISSWKQLKIYLFSYSYAFPEKNLFAIARVAVFDPVTAQQSLLLAKCFSPMQNYLLGELEILYYGDEHTEIKLLYLMLSILYLMLTALHGLSSM